jgi:hypothetical protein
MKKILSILLFSLLSIAAFSQARLTDRILFENAAGNVAGTVTVQQLRDTITFGFAGGTVTSASVVTANGFSGTVANATTTPAITLTTTLSNNIIPKSNGTGFVAAIAGTDYVIPSGTVALATNVTTNANLTGEVTSVGNAATIANLAVTGAKLAVGSVDLASNKVTGLLPNANLANSAITINGTSTSLGGTRSIDLASVTGVGATTATATTFSGGLTSSGAITISNQLNMTPATTSTGATLTIAGTASVIPINSTSTTTATVTAGIAGNPVIELPLLSTSTGSVVINSSGSETFNGSSTFTVNANSQNSTIKLRKISATAWIASLNQ